MAEVNSVETIQSSFRDPSGFLFYRNGMIHRQINISYKENYDYLMNSGLYDALVSEGLLIPHKEAGMEGLKSEGVYKIIQPEKAPFISYPYEWCFSQLKDAALATLKIQKRSLSFGMSFKDSSAYNIQFIKGKPILIDTLSFEKYQEGRPWIAYRQFCQHFLAPLVLMSCRDVRLDQLSRIYMDGIPLDLAGALLPWWTYFSFPLLSHIHLHAQSQKRLANIPVRKEIRGMSRFALLALLDNLESAVRELKWKPKKTEWSGYYEDNSYSSEALQHKKEIVADYLNRIKPNILWDLGANTGVFSRIAAANRIETISFDADPACVEKNYLECVKGGEKHILPLLLDLTNPSPGIGWAHQERMSLVERGPADALLALAFVHHLAIANNLPFEKIAQFFANICGTLVIEFAPKTDPQVKRLVLTREDIFPGYAPEVFEGEFRKYFEIQASAKINDSKRVLYLMRKL